MEQNTWRFSSLVERFIKKHGLENSVKLLGYRTDIIALIKASDIVILPSFREGLPVAVMEAMACGKPVFASDIRGVRDLISAGQGGYLFAPNDVAAVTRLLDEALKEATVLKAFGQSIRNRSKRV